MKRRLESRKRFLDALKVADQDITNRLGIFEGFFQTTNAVGLAPRIDWEVLGTIVFLNRQKEWLSANLTNAQPLTRGEDWTGLPGRVGDSPDSAVVSNALRELTLPMPVVSNDISDVETAIQTAG